MVIVRDLLEELLKSDLLKQLQSVRRVADVWWYLVQ